MELQNNIINPPESTYIGTNHPSEIGNYIRNKLLDDRKLIWIPLTLAFDRIQLTVFQKAFEILKSSSLQAKFEIDGFSLLDCYLLAIRPIIHKKLVDIIDPENAEVFQTLQIHMLDVGKTREEYKAKIKKEAGGIRDKDEIPSPIRVILEISESLKGLNLENLEIVGLERYNEDEVPLKKAEYSEKLAFSILERRIAEKRTHKPLGFEEGLLNYKESIIEYSIYFKNKILELLSLYSKELLTNYNGADLLISSTKDIELIIKEILGLDNNSKQVKDIKGPFFEMINRIVTEINNKYDNIENIILSISKEEWIKSFIRHYYFHSIKSAHPNMVLSDVQKLTDILIKKIVEGNLLETLLQNFKNNKKTFFQTTISLGSEFDIQSRAVVKQWLENEES